VNLVVGNQFKVDKARSSHWFECTLTHPIHLQQIGMHPKKGILVPSLSIDDCEKVGAFSRAAKSELPGDEDNRSLSTQEMKEQRGTQKDAGVSDSLRKLWESYKKKHPGSKKPPPSLVEEAKKVEDKKEPEPEKKEPKKKPIRITMEQKKSLSKQIDPNRFEGIHPKARSMVKGALPFIKKLLGDEEVSAGDLDKAEKYLWGASDPSFRVRARGEIENKTDKVVDELRSTLKGLRGKDSLSDDLDNKREEQQRRDALERKTQDWVKMWGEGQEANRKEKERIDTLVQQAKRKPSAKTSYTQEWPVSDEEFIKSVRGFALLAGASHVSPPGINVGIHVTWNHLTESTPGNFGTHAPFNMMFLFKHFDGGLVEFGMYTAFHNKSNNRFLTKIFQGKDVELLFRKFRQRLVFTVRAIPQLMKSGVLMEMPAKTGSKQSKVVSVMSQIQNKVAMDKTAFTQESADFVEWALLNKDRVTAAEAQRLLERMGLEIQEPPAPGAGPKRGPLDMGEQVHVEKSKNTNSLNVDACEKWDDHVGTIHEVKPDFVVVQFEQGDRIQFMGNDSGAKTGLYRWTPSVAADKPGRGVIEIVYVSDKTAPPPSTQQIEMVQDYVARGLATGESRVDVYYTGLPLKMAHGKDGFYFTFFPTQRLTPLAGAHPRSVNPAKGKLFYMGILGKRPGGWENDLAKKRAQLGVTPDMAHLASSEDLAFRASVIKLAKEVPAMQKYLVPILRKTVSK
jgi:hypothetical protein